MQIARDWNTSGYEGYVLRFNVRAEFLSKYEVHVAGSSIHLEYWIPANHIRNGAARRRKGSVIAR